MSLLWYEKAELLVEEQQLDPGTQGFRSVRKDYHRS